MDAPDVTRRFRLIGCTIVLGAVLVRLLLSAAAAGTNDVGYFTGFAETVRSLGPIGIYELDFQTPYNHPPLVGWFLSGLNWLTDRGIGFAFALRILPILADAAAITLVMRIVRPRYGARAALVMGALVACSPILILISAVHGNLDTVFGALVLLSLFLMVEKRWPAAAGVVGAVAVGIKLVPLIVIPVIALSGASRRALLRYAAPFVVVSAAIWLPAIVQQPDGVVDNVLGYRGQNAHWGLSEIGMLLGIGRGALSSALPLMGIFASGLSMLFGIWYLVRTRYASPYAAAGLAFAALLVLSPAWGSQYMAWPAVLLFFLGARLAVSYSIAAGAFVYVLYTGWSGGSVLDPIRATLRVSPLGRGLGLLAWAILIVAVVSAIVRARRSSPSELEHGDPAETHRAIPEPVGVQAAEQPLRRGNREIPGHVEEAP